MGVVENENSKEIKDDFEDKTLSHCTIKQLLTGKIRRGDSEADDALFVDGKRVHQLMLYGTVENIKHQSICTLVVLNDCTGRISIKFWHSDDNKVRAKKFEG